MGCDRRQTCRSWRPPVRERPRTTEAFRMEALRRNRLKLPLCGAMAANMDGYFAGPAAHRHPCRHERGTDRFAAVHEIAHSKLHNYAKRSGRKRPGPVTRSLVRRPQHRGGGGRRASPTRFASITVSRPARTASAISPTGARTRRCRNCGASLETINKAAGELITTLTGIISYLQGARH